MTIDTIARDAMAASEKAPADPAQPAAGIATVGPDVEILEDGQLNTAQASAGVVT